MSCLALLATASAFLMSIARRVSRIFKVPNSADSSSEIGCVGIILSGPPDMMSLKSSSEISTCPPLIQKRQALSPDVDSLRTNSRGLERANVTISSQLTGDCSRPNDAWMTLIGPSNSFSKDFRSNGPTSFAPRLAARLS